MDDKLLEARLSRVYQHLNDDEICLISACRGTNTPEQNNKQTARLANDLLCLHYSYIKVSGGCIEDKGKPTEREVTEDSFFVINNKANKAFEREMLFLCGRYDQDAILLKTKTLEPAWYDRNGNKVSNTLSKFSIHDIENGFTKVHGSRFSLISESIDSESELKSPLHLSGRIYGASLRKLMEKGLYEFPKPELNTEYTGKLHINQKGDIYYLSKDY